MFHQIFPDGPEPSSSHGHQPAKPAHPHDAVTPCNAGDTSRLLEQGIAARHLELLEARRSDESDGVSALHIALSTGNADAVRAFAELLHAVPAEQRAGVLAAPRPDGVPGLQIALQRGHADAIRAFGELLVHLPGEQHADILAGRTQDRPMGLRLALRNLHADALREFDMLLERYCVPMQRCAGQIMDAANDIHFVLRQIGQDSNSAASAAMEAYVALVIRAATALTAAQRASLLMKFHLTQKTGSQECPGPCHGWNARDDYEQLKNIGSEIFHLFKLMNAMLSLAARFGSVHEPEGGCMAMT